MLIFLDLANFTVAPPPFKLDQGYVAFFFSWVGSLRHDHVVDILESLNL